LNGRCCRDLCVTFVSFPRAPISSKTNSIFKRPRQTALARGHSPRSPPPHAHGHGPLSRAVDSQDSAWRVVGGTARPSPRHQREAEQGGAGSGYSSTPLACQTSDVKRCQRRPPRRRSVVEAGAAAAAPVSRRPSAPPPSPPRARRAAHRPRWPARTAAARALRRAARRRQDRRRRAVARLRPLRRAPALRRQAAARRRTACRWTPRQPLGRSHPPPPSCLPLLVCEMRRAEGGVPASCGVLGSVA